MKNRDKKNKRVFARLSLLYHMSRHDYEQQRRSCLLLTIFSCFMASLWLLKGIFARWLSSPEVYLSLSVIGALLCTVMVLKIVRRYPVFLSQAARLDRLLVAYVPNDTAAFDNFKQAVMNDPDCFDKYLGIWLDIEKETYGTVKTNAPHYRFTDK